MTIQVKHSKVSTIPDTTDTSLVRPSDWNADHTLVGTIDVPNGGTGASTLTGYVKGNGTSAMTASATVPSTDITGLGTMSTQNANAVAITGGTINGTTIGATTPSSIVGTTITGQTGVLRGTGQNLLLWSADFSNAVWANLSSNVTYTSTTINFTNASAYAYQLINPTVAGLTYTFSVTLSSTNKTAIAIRIAGTATGGGGQTLITLTSTPTRYSVTVTIPSGNSAVYVGFENRVGTGGDGSLGSITVSNAQLEIGSVVNTYVATTSAQIYGTPTLSFSGVSTLGLESNGALFLQPAGTGAIQAQATTSTTAGGNVRGANAVDWQTVRSAASQVASGAYSVLCGGGSYGSPAGNSAGGTACFTGGGWANTSGTQASVVVGGNNNTATALNASILGGGSNTASLGAYPAIVGGQSNTAAGYYNFIGGGFTNSGTSGSAVTTQSATMNATTAVTLSGSNANIKVGQYITGTSISGDTYVAAISGTALTLSKVASGSSTSTLSFFTPHGVVVGGGNNQATGSYSFIGGGGDAGTAANRNVASGDWSVVGGGRGNTSSGNWSATGGGSGNANTGSYATIGGGSANGIYASYGTIAGGLVNGATGFGSSVLGGYANSASGSYSSALGGTFGTTRSIDSSFAFGTGSPISGTAGVSQAGLLVLGVQTTDATATALRSNTSAASTTNQVILPNNSAYFFTGEVISGVTGGGNTKGWTIEGVIKRGADAASTTLVGTPTVTSMYADVGAATWTIAVTADTTNGGIRITFTGQASTTIRTVCQIRTTETTF